MVEVVWIQMAGLGLGLVGAFVITLADTWLSRSLLVYLDAIEANIEKLMDTLRAGSTQFAVPEIDLKRDRRQDRARALKTVGWLAMTVSFALQVVAAYLTKFPA